MRFLTLALSIFVKASLAMEPPSNLPAQPGYDAKLGAQRLKALLEIELIYNRSDAGNALTPDDRAALREIVRSHWQLFSFKMRKEFKKYFTLKELDALEHFSAPQSVNDIMPQVLKPLTANPPPPPPASLAELEPKKPVAVLPEAAGGTSPEAFKKFLLDAPYSREVKSLLSLISKKAQEPARSDALTAVVMALPRILLDPSKMGRALRSRRLPTGPPSGNPNYQIAVNPEPVILSRRKFLFGNADILLSGSTESYASLNLDEPPQAISRQTSPSRNGLSDWGSTDYYDDGSRRGRFSPEEQAGSLLYELTLLHLQIQGKIPSPYASEAAARTAQWMFYAGLKETLEDDKFLDPEMRATMEQWSASPWEARDHLVHAFFAGKPSDGPELEGASAAFSFNIPTDWQAFGENEPSGLVVHILGPDNPSGTFRTGIDIHRMENERPEFVPLKNALETIRRKDSSTKRSSGSIGRINTGAGLARLLEVRETRALPSEQAPSSPAEIHHHVTFIENGDSYYIIRLSSTQDVYLDYRDEFFSLLKSFQIKEN